MSKSTKIIAALGVAAGLGVAALPVASFAATTQDVPLKVTVSPVLELEATTTGAFASDDGITLAAGASDSASATTLTAKANNTSGWKVTVASTGTKDAKKNATLTTGKDDIAPLQTAVADIAASEETGWGIKLDSVSSAADRDSDFVTDKFTGMTENAVVYGGKAPTVTAGVSAKAIYGVHLNDGTASGTYEGSITYTIANAD